METTTQYLTPGQYRSAKARLTRAIRSGNPLRIIGEVNETFADWDAGGFAWPDDWSRWERARYDAEYAHRVATW